MKKEKIIKGLLLILGLAVLFVIGLRIGKHYGAKQKQAEASAGSVR